MKKDALSTDPYKGVRDFYPEDQFVQKYMFETLARTCELFGYEEYNASVLEPTDLYRSKTSEEIVNEQTYTFKDRGDREVTMRPEMTPTLARMIAAKVRDIPMPARWYSVANFFRYEQVRKGRQREFWQLNADILGAPSVEADAEVIALAYATMRAFGADERNFELRVSDRRFLDAAYEACGIDPSECSAVTRLLDKRAKVENFKAELEGLVGSRAEKLIEHLDRTTSTAYLEKLGSQVKALGVGNMVVDTTIARGFDYYTGMVFEVFDTSGENKRSLFGGGRYDGLVGAFGVEPLPAVGFAVGDVALRDFLATHNLLPKYTPATELMLCVVDEAALGHANKLAQELRRSDVTVAVNISLKRVGDQVRQADKMKVPFVIAVGEKERDSGKYTVKNLASGDEKTLTADRIAEHLFSSLGEHMSDDFDILEPGEKPDRMNIFELVTLNSLSDTAWKSIPEIEESFVNLSKKLITRARTFLRSGGESTQSILNRFEHFTRVEKRQRTPATDSQPEVFEYKLTAQGKAQKENWFKIPDRLFEQQSE